MSPYPGSRARQPPPLRQPPLLGAPTPLEAG